LGSSEGSGPVLRSVPMDSRFQRLRSVTFLGLGWGASWAAFAVILVSVIARIDPEQIDVGEGPVDVARILGTVGFASGAAFGILLLVFERRRTLAEVPLIRAVLWGVIGSAALPLLTTIHDEVLLNTCPLGAISALASAGLARWALRWRSASA